MHVFPVAVCDVCVACVVNLYVYYCYNTNQTTDVALQNQGLLFLQLS